MSLAITLLGLVAGLALWFIGAVQDSTPLLFVAAVLMMTSVYHLVT